MIKICVVKTNAVKKNVFSFAVAIALGFSFLITTSAGAIEDTRTLTLTGVGKVTAIPDYSSIRFNVSSVRSTGALAQQAVTRTQKKIVNALVGYAKEHQVYSGNESNIDIITDFFGEFKTESLYVQEERDYSESRITIKGYRASQSTLLELPIEITGNIFDIIIGQGPNVEVHSVQQFLSENDEAMDLARKRAARNARKVARTYADAFGMQLGKPLSITVDRSYSPYIRTAAAEDAIAPSLQTEIHPGTLEIEASVTVVFEIT